MKISRANPEKLRFTEPTRRGGVSSERRLKSLYWLDAWILYHNVNEFLPGQKWLVNLGKLSKHAFSALWCGGREIPMHEEIVFSSEEVPFLLYFADNTARAVRALRCIGQVIGSHGGVDDREWTVKLIHSTTSVDNSLKSPMLTNLQNWLAVLVKNVCCERAVRFCHLTHHHSGHRVLLLGHETNMVSVRIHNDIFVCLLESAKDCESSHQNPSWNWEIL